jgi:PAS domain S-box-containing protein
MRAISDVCMAFPVSSPGFGAVLVRKMVNRSIRWNAMIENPEPTLEAGAPDSTGGTLQECIDFSDQPAPRTLAEAMDRLDVEGARRQQAEEALREAESRFRQFSEHAGKFLWMSDPNTEELIYVSPGYEQVWARSREDRYASPREWQTSIGRGRRDTAAKRESQYQVAGPNGSVCWIRDRVFPIRDSSGQIVRMLGIAEDITDAKQAQEALVALQAKCRALLAVLPEMVFRLKKDGTILECNAGDAQFLLAEPALVGKNIKDLLPSSLLGEVTHHLVQAFKTHQVQTFTCQFLVPDEVRDFEARGVVCGDNEVLVVVRDITDRKRLEREILEVSSREQQRIGQDLHDTLGQHLTGITFMTKVLERRLAPKKPEEAKEAAEIGRLVLQALAQTRNLARGLFPVELEQNGLVSAIAELAESVERMCKVKCNLKADESLVFQDNVMATHVFRIAQEAINNSVKHSKGKQVDISLASSPDGAVVLSVTDDGVGFSPEAKRDGLGLRIMHYRARRIGGNLEVTQPETGGTRVTCTFRKQYESN